MDLKDHIRLDIDTVQLGTTRVLQGLNQQELMWRPCSGCNSIGLIYFHMARLEDSFLQKRMQGKPEIWETEKWYQKLNLPVSEAGAHYTVEQVNAFPVPAMEDLKAYADAGRQHTLEYLNNLTPEEFDRVVTLPRFGEISIAAAFARLVGHLAQHVGEISYLRGIQRGMDK